ncbi:MAG: tetratricopeptide repeat protein, partial [Nocardioidaceae bacterium]|nr:tetratricopeptide repeat protein [Nocardioidaceae bacterium]
MAALPSGTVSMLFSDMEGSTSLLSRLGDAYVQALDGQRQILRASWARCGGVEMGTEGDSFFVVFDTAEAAVNAAATAQASLLGFEWPAGAQIRVRMGIHSGNPLVHDGGYVGMDVHRAARIAGSAHGGQVVLSSATAGLVTEHLPAGAWLVDLGSHQLKDIASTERLFQLCAPGLPTEFPPLKTLGAASSLPVPATSLVGRDGELAELRSLLCSAGVRLVTLTGPGGTGKTRLAVGLAKQLVDAYPDGVYFVPLATITGAHSMWTSIAEVLDAPPEGRIPPGFFDHVGHRSALIVLDNLEQIAGADSVVADLLAAAPQVVLITTSRRPLHLTAEHEHSVPPLELPDEHTLEGIERSGAVQLFVERAQKAKASFRLTSDNAADVAAICVRLDGLPLAIELTAARSKLLSPRAALARLDQSLDLRSRDVDRPDRQRTLRQTISWSYDLLTTEQQAFFRRLGVFAGGADLDSIGAVMVDLPEAADPLDIVTDIIDVSLAVVSEGIDGEPRVHMLETVRAFALDALDAAGELPESRRLHAEQYLAVARPLQRLANSPRQTAARQRLETEHDNLREALRWALGAPSEAKVSIALQICDALGWFWIRHGYLAEGREWLERTVEAAGGQRSTGNAACLHLLSFVLHLQGENEAALRCARESASISRSSDDSNNLVKALNVLGVAYAELDQQVSARHTLQDAVDLARATDNAACLMPLLGDLGVLEAKEGHFEEALKWFHEAARVAEELGDEAILTQARNSIVEALVATGRTHEALSMMPEVATAALRLRDPRIIIYCLET